MTFGRFPDLEFLEKAMHGQVYQVGHPNKVKYKGGGADTFDNHRQAGYIGAFPPPNPNNYGEPRRAPITSLGRITLYLSGRAVRGALTPEEYRMLAEMWTEVKTWPGSRQGVIPALEHDTLIDIRTRDGNERFGVKAGHFEWDQFGYPDDIIAWRRAVPKD